MSKQTAYMNRDIEFPGDAKLNIRRILHEILSELELKYSIEKKNQERLPLSFQSDVMLKII